MVLEKLINKRRKGIATIGILGMLGSVGCSTLSEGEIATVAGEVIAESSKSELERLAGNILFRLGTMKYQKELAEAGRTQIVFENTVYKDGKYEPREGYTWVDPKDSEDPRVKPFFGSGFAFRWVDYNRNDSPDTAEEFVEQRDRFKQNESMVLWLYYEAESPFIQNLQIYDPIGRIISERKINPFQKKASVKQYLYYVTAPEKLEKIHEGFWEWNKGFETSGGVAHGLNMEYINWLLSVYGEGEYSAVWRVNGKIMDSITFDIIH
jgi:hypothetical protein